ncbi:MAG: hypothetical protein OJI67_19800 [Prosthecobacter sp.]|nr:hypothetical protein [Prosthecobacter sp.]
MKSLDQKLQAIHANPAQCKEFILADAKDADMGFGRTAPGPIRRAGIHESLRYKTREDYLNQVREVIWQGLVDIMLLSASNLEKLAIREKRFVRSSITPAARANDSSDIWIIRNSVYSSVPSKPFRSATLDHIQYGRLSGKSTKVAGADLGLYSLTFCNDMESDHATLEAFHAFRHEAERKRFRYFLEVFAPNIASAVPPKDVGLFLNDHIIRCLAGVCESGRPLFLKIPYCGPRALEELVSYDPHLIVGILGGAAGTTLDAFQLLYDAKKHGARVALFGRKINLAEHPLAMVELLRSVADDKISPKEAVKLYHDRLQKEGIRSFRPLREDLKPAPVLNRYG